jgi:hypothetical protein
VSLSKAAVKDLRQAAARIGSLNDDLVRESANHAIESALEFGGKFGNTTLRARVVASKNSKKEVSVTVWPTPAWSWSVASYGRSPLKPTKKEALRFKAGGRIVHAANAKGVATGDKRVERWHDQCYGNVVPLAEQLTEAALNG